VDGCCASTANAAIAKWLLEILWFDRCDVRPDAVFGAEFPNAPSLIELGPGSRRSSDRTFRPVPARDGWVATPPLVRDCQPGDAAIGAAIKIGSCRGHRRIKRGCRTAGFAAGGSNSTVTMPTACWPKPPKRGREWWAVLEVADGVWLVVLMFGKLSTFCHVAPRSALFHNPSAASRRKGFCPDSDPLPAVRR